VVAPILIGSLRYARGKLLVWILVPVVVAVFLNLAPSEPIWRNWIIALVQFPWRLMVFVDFATAIAVALLVSCAADRIGRSIMAGLMAIAVPAALVGGPVRNYALSSVSQQPSNVGFGAIEYLSPEMIEFLSIRLDRPDLDHFDQKLIAKTIEKMASEFAEKNPDIGVVERGNRSLMVLAEPNAEFIALPIQCWVFWSARTSEGAKLATRVNPMFGTLDIIAPPGGFNQEPLVVSLDYHSSELVGGAASLVAFTLLLLILFQRRRSADGFVNGF
jgi:hypothetical protein